MLKSLIGQLVFSAIMGAAGPNTVETGRQAEPHVRKIAHEQQIHGQRIRKAAPNKQKHHPHPRDVPLCSSCFEEFLALPSRAQQDAEIEDWYKAIRDLARKQAYPNAQ